MKVPNKINDLGWLGVFEIVSSNAYNYKLNISCKLYIYITLLNNVKIKHEPFEIFEQPS